MYKYLLISVIYTILLFSYAYTQNNLSPDEEDFGDRLKIGYVWQGNISFNPLLPNNDYDIEINKLIYGPGLFSKDNNGKIVNNLALKSKIQDPNVIRIELRSDLKFHDGSFISAQDVESSFNLYKKFSYLSPPHFNARLINSIETYGGDVVRFKLAKPMPDFSETIGQLPILPQNICKIWLKTKSLNEIQSTLPIGIGYFKFVDYKQKQYLRLDSFEQHPIGKSYLAGIDFLFYENQDKLLEAFLKEEVDLIEINDKSEIQKVAQFSKKTIKTNSEKRKLYYINLNTQNLPFRVIGIRQALNYAINKEQIVSYLTSANSNDMFPELTTNPVSNPRYFIPYNYKPMNALEILYNSRFRKNSQGKLVRNNKELQFELLVQKGSLFEESIARIIAINLGDVGINAVPLSMESDKLNKMVVTGQYQAVLRNFDFNPKNANESLRSFYYNELNNLDGFQNFKNTSIELGLEFAAVESNNASINRLTNTFLNQMKRYSPCIFLFFKENKVYAVNPRLENISTILEIHNKSLKLLKPKNEWFVKKNNHKY